MLIFIITLLDSVESQLKIEVICKYIRKCPATPVTLPSYRDTTRCKGKVYVWVIQKSFGCSFVILDFDKI